MSNLPFMRPANLADLETVLSFSEKAGFGITSLPRNAKVLQQKLASSEVSFSKTFVTPKHETYLFCLEQENQVIGISGIISRIGMTEPFFAYHLQFEHRACSALKKERDDGILHFIRARKKPTEIGMLFLDPDFRHRHLGMLLSFGRFLFMANFRFRFASVVIAEMRGFNQNGKAPFWEAVGKPFFEIEFNEADYLRATHPECIEEFFPYHPIYLDLISKDARASFGKLHPETVPAFKLLTKQGFKESHYYDIFDSGPHLYAPFEHIHAISKSQIGVVKEIRSHLENDTVFLVSNTHLDFRASASPLIVEKKERVIMHKKLADVLKVDIGDPIRFYHLETKSR